VSNQRSLQELATAHRAPDAEVTWLASSPPMPVRTSRSFDACIRSSRRAAMKRDHWRPRELARLPNTTNAVFSNDGELLALSAIQATDEENIVALDAASQHESRTFPSSGCDRLQFSPDSIRPLAVCPGVQVRSWNPKDGSVAPQIPLRAADGYSASQAVFSPGGDVVALFDTNLIGLWDVATGAQVGSLVRDPADSTLISYDDIPAHTIRGAAFSMDGSKVAFPPARSSFTSIRPSGSSCHATSPIARSQLESDGSWSPTSRTTAYARNSAQHETPRAHIGLAPELSGNSLWRAVGAATQWRHNTAPSDHNRCPCTSDFGLFACRPPVGVTRVAPAPPPSGAAVCSS
jgi:hypothetical protein